ncbi:TetR/AcrR family transcriptional regulator [Demequina sp. NBRC 110054]|uniref:TetR/AcrR family transcriptional regulator n=1 Tax=Demequina sp. NBRC 110054 TaxID=1570343 RepID=UPI000A065F0B|nr:TetR/AcrR family transcriptional regulator [Demequina sp. NBRC 110054]
MRSASDLSTPARIREAAIAVFAEEGFGAGIRTVAARASVAPGLVMHHFGSKDGLREACDAHVVESLVGEKLAGDATAASLAALFGSNSEPHHSDALPLAAYLRRMLADGSDAALLLFDRLAAATTATLTAQQAQGAIRRDVDVAAIAPMVTLYGLAPVAMPELLARAVGRATVDEGTLSLAAAALGPVLAQGLYAPPSAAAG